MRKVELDSWYLRKLEQKLFVVSKQIPNRITTQLHLFSNNRSF